MKSLRNIFIPLAFGLIFPLICLYAQNWSEPVAVTTGAGDDHNLDVRYDFWPDPVINLVWDRTCNGNTDIYVRKFYLSTGQLGPEIRLTDRPSVDEKPCFTYYLWYENGILFQSDMTENWSIYYIAETDSAYDEPVLTLYSNVNLYEPIFCPMNTCLGPIPTVFLRSDSAAISYVYGWEDYFQIPQDTSFFISVANSDYPVHSLHGYWDSSNWVITAQMVRYVWEIDVGGQCQIEYIYMILLEPSIIPTTYQGIISHPIYSYHNPLLRSCYEWGYTPYHDMYLECETPSGFDIVSTRLNPETGQWSSPEPLFPSTGNEKNLSESFDNFAFEVDWNGNWDIAFWHPNLGDPEIINTDPAEDYNPLIVCDWYFNDQLYVFWESNREGVWNIYYSCRDFVGVEDGHSVQLPKDMYISIYPNPSNAAFKISLNPVVGGAVRARIYDLSGRLVSKIYDGWLPVGLKSLYWDVSGQPSGMYLLRVESQESAQIKKIVLMK